MKQLKRIKQRFLAGLLCVVLVMADICLTGVQVSASEPETDVLKEAFYEEEVTTGSEDMTEADAFGENADTGDTQQEEAELSETEDMHQEEAELSETEDTQQEAASQLEPELVEKEELTGVYQFGGAPSEEDTEAAEYSADLEGIDNTAKLQEYIYQQMLARIESINIKNYNIAWSNVDEVKGVVRAVINEHPELYFVNGSFSYSGISSSTGTIVSEIKVTYYNDFDDTAFKNATQRALATVRSGMSDLEKAIALHDYLSVNCEYDYENYLSGSIPKESYTTYGTLVNRMAVCQGYALTYKYLLSQVGINCYMVSSSAMNHAWNLIELNGKYYHVDVTWDDPYWDLIGRARHQYMLRSDAAFITECEHYSWSVTKGSEVVAYEATDTSYDSAFWLDCDAPLVLIGKDCYYAAYDSVKRTGVINKTTLSDITGTGESICDIGRWPVWGGSGNWIGAYSGLFQANNRLYYNDNSSIYSIAPDSTESDRDKRAEFTADTTNGYIYGSAFCQGKVLYSLRQTPNINSKETVLIADINIEIENPSETPVEKIELDKSTITLAKGETVELIATVMPSNATDATVTWSSSDSSVAAVEDGVVTAVSEGNCVVTASAGIRKATCTVIVTADGDIGDIPGTTTEPHITVQKTKVTYECGDSIDTDDLLVTYYDSEGMATIVTDYTTNASEIDMSIPGTKTLTVNYNGLTASVELTVTEAGKPDPDKETYTVTFNLQGHGTALQEYSAYTDISKGSKINCPESPQAEGYEFTGWYKDTDCKTLWDFEKDTVEADTTLYAGWKKSEDTGNSENTEKKPLINSVLFPKQKSEYSAVYTGEQIRPVMIVAYKYTDDKGNAKTQKLKLNVDYTVSYSNNVDVGENTAEVTVTGIGEYAGSITKEFTIEQKSIKNVTLSAVGDIVFGEPPSVRVTDGTKELVEDKDYSIKLSTNGTAGADTQSVLTVEGKGNYTGTSKKSVKFNILKKETDILSITDESIHVEFKKFPAKGYTYNGKAQKPGVVVTDTTTGKKLSSSMYKVIYSNNINAGKGTAKAWVVGISKNGKGYYGISEPLSFDINQKDFSKVSVSLSGTIPKTGSIQDIENAIGEAILVKDAKHVLSGDEYTIDYGEIITVDDIKIGTKYQITLTPETGGNYIDNSKKTFKIKFGQLSLASKTANISVKITDVMQSKIELIYNGILLEAGRDYVATVKKDKNKNTYTVKINAVKNSAYKGSRTLKNMVFDPGLLDDVPEIPVIPSAKPAVSNNKDMQNYRWYSNYNWNWADTVKSYLYENQEGTLTRVEYIDGEIVAEDYNNNFELTAGRKIPMELSIWGGFYAGEQYNFLIFGQENPSEDDNMEVVRVVRYSKNWKRLGDARLCGANTVVPFEAGSLRCAEYGDYLYIRTCHKMYASSDGKNHQANMTLAVRQSDMTITDSFYQVMNSCVGYASHSFNQFILVDQNRNLVTLDHGDAYPRSILLTRPAIAKAGDDKLSGGYENSELVTFPGTIGDNYTGASIGGFAETQNGYVTAFNYDDIGGKGSRAVYLGYTGKNGLASQAEPITEYDGMLTPVLASAGLDGGYMMWTDSKDKFYYTRYADGGTIGTINTADASLSDCQPILHNGELVWYVTKKTVPTFFRLDVTSSEISKIVAK